MTKRQLDQFFDDLDLCDLSMAWAARVVGVSKYAMTQYRRGAYFPGITASERIELLHQALKQVLQIIERIETDDSND